jgi:hypothetical protein
MWVDKGTKITPRNNIFVILGLDPWILDSRFHRNDSINKNSMNFTTISV